MRRVSGAKKRKPRPIILLVEDEDFVRDAAAQILQEAGYRVLEARSAAEALNYDPALVQRVQLLFSDVVLPDKSGHELAAQLLKRRPVLKVIFTSGYPEKDPAQKVIMSSFFLQKPFSGENLKGFVGRVLRGDVVCSARVLKRSQIPTALS